MRTDTSAHPLETQLRVVRTPDLVAELHQTADRQTQIRTLETRIGSLLPQYQKLEEKIVQAVPGFDPNPIVAPFRVHALSQLLPTDRPTAYIHLHWFGDEAHAVVMSALGSHPVRLPGLTRETLNDALMPLAAMQFSKSEARQLGPAITAVTALVGDQLRRHLIEPLLPVIEQANAQRLVFVPEGAMSFLPLHAVPLSESEHLVDRYEVAYAPSLSILDQCRRRKRSHPTRYVNAVNPLKEPDFARLEADMVREHFAESQVIAASDVTRDSFLKEAPWGHVVSWSGHARFLPMVPLWSGLVCHRANDSVPPDDVISMMDIDAGLSLPDCTLAVLAGCQSGLALAGAGNEYVSLVGAFLNAGAQCALASLWPVDDFATMLTIERFFHHWRAGQTMAASLRTTQQWLRTTTAPELQEHIRREILPKTSDPDENIARRVKVLGFMADDNRPYESPFYWAPFVVVGLSYPLENGNEIAGRM